MPDDKPLLQDRKLLYVAPLVIAAIVALIVLVTLGRQPPAHEVKAPPRQYSESKPKQPPVAVTPPAPLTREDLIKGAQDAADQFAATGKLPSDTDPLIGRKFSIRIPFGCGGIQGAVGLSQTSLIYDAQNQTVTLTATPGVWTTLPLIQAVQIPDLEAVEGFWIPRPWTYSDACPPNIVYAVPATPTPPTGQTLGLAQVFGTGDSRALQHEERPYTFTRKLPQNDPSFLTHSYRLVLEGTVAGFPSGRAVRCWAEAPDHAPTCIYGVTFDRVAFEDGDTHEVLANWNN